MKSLSEIIPLAKLKEKHKIAVVAAHDISVLKAVKKVYFDNLIEPLFIGDIQIINELSRKINFEIRDNWLKHEPDNAKAAYYAVKMASEKKVDIIMKGILPTALFLKAILNHEYGLKEKNTISHLAIFESKFYPKLIGITDAAMNILPSLDEKVKIIENAVYIFNKLGIKKPKVAVLAPIEYVNPNIESTVHASELTQMFRNNKIKNCVIEGPLALDNAISKDAAKLKGIKSEVAGDADILVVPDLNAGNVLYKSLVYLGGAISASVIVGAKVPVILTSRADPEQTKYYSIALASLLD